MREEEEIIQKSYDILVKIGLASYVNEFAKNLPYGAQRRLEIAEQRFAAAIYAKRSGLRFSLSRSTERL